jgi:peptidoglycan hydrolase-like protein with peptidoglycan-binding domain
VHAFPETGVYTVAGNDVQFSLDGQSARLVSGKVLVTDGKISHVLPGSEVEFANGAVRATTSRVRLAATPNLEETEANQVFLDSRLITARGSGFVVSGSERTDLLAGGEDPTFVSRTLRNELRLNGGSVRVEPREGLLNRPDGLRVFDVKGDVDVVSGPLKWNSRNPRNAGAEQRGFGGTMMWIEQGDDVYELDPRPMYSTFDPATGPGRARKLEPVMSERFKAADRATARAVADGRAQIAPGDQASPAFVNAVQKSLEYFLGRKIPETRQMDADTVEALRDFQRFNALEPTGVIDADTFAMLDEIAPALDRPTVHRIVSGPLAGEVAKHVEGILNGTNPAISYRRGGANPKGPLVRVVQRQIGTQADGVMGSGTVSQLRTWQQQHRVPVTGAIDAATLRKMVELTGTRTESMIQPRPKLMVMVAMNDDVPDELRRFRELAAHRGAQAVIIGPEDQPLQDGRELARYLAMAESGAVDMDWLTITGHSTGRSTWGKLGRFEYTTFSDWRSYFPRAFAQVEKLNLMNCYNVTPERARNFWPSTFPNLQVAAGFMYSAPGKESQSSDEFLLNSGRIMADIEKGEELSQYASSSMASRFERDDFIKWQNAAIFFRTADNPDGVFGMTATARREMEMHGAEEELRAIPERFTTAFDNYFNAASEEHAEPPSGHNSILRQYLGAVQHIVDRWEGRMQLYRQFVEDEERFLESARARYVAANGSDEGFQRPSRDDYPAELRARAEEYNRAHGWENEYENIQKLRAKILNLVKSHSIQNQFALFNGPTIHAFNRYVEDSVAAHNAANPDGEQLTPVLLPQPEEWGHMTRRQMLLRLEEVANGLSQLDYRANRETIYEQDWAIMSGRNPYELEFTSPSSFMSYAHEFVRQLEPDLIQPEWLDDSLLERDLATSARARAQMTPPAPVEPEGGAQPSTNDPQNVTTPSHDIIS